MVTTPDEYTALTLDVPLSAAPLLIVTLSSPKTPLLSFSKCTLVPSPVMVIALPAYMTAASLDTVAFTTFAPPWMVRSASEQNAG